MDKKKHYLVIDHVGQLSRTEFPKVYAEAYAKAKELGYEKNEVFTMKQVCKKMSPFCKDPSPKFKMKARHEKNPERVILIVSEESSTATFVEELWKNKCIPCDTWVINAPEAMQVNIDETDEEMMRKRRVVARWAPALGIELSAPAIRDQREDAADDFAFRPSEEIKKMRSDYESEKHHYTRPYTSDEAYLKKKMKVATDEEINAAYDLIEKIKTEGRMPIREFLEIDWHICKKCKEPVYISRQAREVKCECGQKYYNRFIWDVYYDDRGYTEDDCEGDI